EAERDVHGRPAADALAAAHRDGAVVGRARPTVGVQPLHHLPFTAGHRLAAEVAAALDQDDAQIGLLGQRRGQHRPRGARTDHEDVAVDRHARPSYPTAWRSSGSEYAAI